MERPHFGGVLIEHGAVADRAGGTAEPLPVGLVGWVDAQFREAHARREVDGGVESLAVRDIVRAGDAVVPDDDAIPRCKLG